MSGRDDRDTRELLDELATTLDALRADLADGDARERRRGPPTPRELLRVTEEYTIPAVVATLEAAIAALELLRAVLRLADPGRTAAGGGDRRSTDVVGRAGESAVVGAERALSELRRALSAADLPEERGGDLAADARALSAEVESRLRAARAGDGARADDDAADESGGVRIDVEPAEQDGASGDGDGDSASEGADGVDVDAELDSIRREVRDAADVGSSERGDEETDPSGQTDAGNDSGSADDGDGSARADAGDDAGPERDEGDPGRDGPG